MTSAASDTLIEVSHKFVKGYRGGNGVSTPTYDEAMR